MLLETEAFIEKEIQDRGLANLTDANKALRKSLAGTVINLQFERIHYLIWHSQLVALIFLNEHSYTPTPEADLKRFYTEAAAEYPKLYENFSFQNWLGFLTSHVLVLEAKDGLSITVRG